MILMVSFLNSFSEKLHANFRDFERCLKFQKTTLAHMVNGYSMHWEYMGFNAGYLDFDFILLYPFYTQELIELYFTKGACWLHPHLAKNY